MAKKRRKSNFFSFPLLVFLTIICVFLVFSNVKIYQERSKNIKELEGTKKDLEQITLQTDSLRAQVVDRHDEALIERMAREQLLLQREGESVVVISRTEEEDVEEEEEENPGFFEQLMNIFR